MKTISLANRIKKLGIPLNTFASYGVLKTSGAEILYARSAGATHTFRFTQSNTRHEVRRGDLTELPISTKNFRTVYTGDGVYIFEYPEGGCGALVVSRNRNANVYTIELYLIPCNASWVKKIKNE